MGLRVGLGIVAVIAIAGAVYLFNGDDGSTTTAATSTTLDPALETTTTLPLCSNAAQDPTAPTTVAPAAPAKPTVTIPTAAPTELKVTTLRAGTGEVSAECDTVDVYYVGVLSADGTEFDENYDKGQGSFPVVIGETSLIQGWTQGLVGLQAGGQYQLDIPAELAYGAAGQGAIPANAPLTFVIDIVGLTKGTPTAPVDTTPTGSTPTGSTPTDSTTVDSTPVTDAVTTTS